MEAKSVVFLIANKKKRKQRNWSEKLYNQAFSFASVQYAGFFENRIDLYTHVGFILIFRNKLLKFWSADTFSISETLYVALCVAILQIETFSVFFF